MADVKIFRTIAGDDIIATVVETKDAHYVIRDAAILVSQETETGVSISMRPAMPYAKEGIIALYANAVAMEALPEDSMVAEYNRIFSKIEVPSSKIILP